MSWRPIETAPRDASQSRYARALPLKFAEVNHEGGEVTETRGARKARKARHRAAMDGVVCMSDEQLKDLSFEMGREKNRLGQQIAELNARIDAVRAERQRRATATTQGFHISDHAVLRYLERIKGVDVASAREEIAVLAAAQKLERHEHTYARQDMGGGVIFGFNGADKTITTIMTSRESAVIDPEEQP